MPKRKPRTKLIKQHDLLYPLPIEKLGTADDPCFGKHHDLKADECRRCGDAEICSIVMSQTLHLTRAKVEAKGHYLDMEEQKAVEMPLGKKIRRLIKKTIKDNKDIRLDEIKLRVRSGLGITEAKFDRYFQKLLDTNAITKTKVGTYTLPK